ncbi:hypothetical protein C8R45DRAFT_1215029 [Mycena sanguinolenta]|nr:hypothetical protein C8R45DRAFT_1215029 [Mycena sanguinolenta]
MSPQTNVELQAYLRVAGYAIAFFDYLQTIPAEYRLYRRQKGIFNLSVPCILFIMVRYLGLAAVIVGNTGFFYHGFTPESCKTFYWAPPVFKLILYTVSQVILALRFVDHVFVLIIIFITIHFNSTENINTDQSVDRTYAVARKALWLRIVLPLLFAVTMAPELVSIFYKRISISKQGNCTSGNPPGIKIASLFYVGALAFDVVTMAITSAYLWKFSNINRSSLTQLTRMMLQDGIIYFVALTGMNTVNLVFFQNPDTAFQPSAAVLGYTATMIYSSRFILNLSEHARDKSETHPSTSRPGRSRGITGHRDRDGTETEMVVKVVQTVVTDMKGVDSQSESDVGKKWGGERGRYASKWYGDQAYRGRDEGAVDSEGSGCELRSKGRIANDCTMHPLIVLRTALAAARIMEAKSRPLIIFEFVALGCGEKVGWRIRVPIQLVT